ncbi:hypothetical protein GOP47_0028844 [Adiantum capillus-veneris]|nr:hypothetical protein GOP47_0028844 [Adiantum capillus-veneris]
MMEGTPRHSHAESFKQKPRMKQKSREKRPRDRIVLCIGGRLLQTSKQTLCVDSDSMLAAWVLRHLHEEDTDLHTNRDVEDPDALEEGDRTGNDEDQILWIDRDAHRFDHVLNYLRNGTIWLEDVASLRAVQEEAVFFGLSGLESLCEERIQALENLKKQHADELRQAICGAILDFCKNHPPSPNTLSGNGSKGEVLAILRGCRLGVPDAPQEPVFQMDDDF